LNQNWIGRNKLLLAPNIIEVTTSFNRFSDLVATILISETDIKKRTLILERLIDTAVHLRELNNFNGVMKVLSGLGKSAVYRLKKTKERLKKKHLVRTFPFSYF
tara:strand:+ start:528 stop:839 length:312 start_codon:yes stop_codon:yes gene_type:complete